MLPARDLYHRPFCNALLKAGWTITSDPYTVRWHEWDLYVDIAADAWDAATGTTLQAAFEGKGFEGSSEVEDLRDALGQYLLYQTVLRHRGDERRLFLAIPPEAWQRLFHGGLGSLVRDDFALNLVVFDPDVEEILRWLPYSD